MSQAAWAFNEDACSKGSAGEQNPHCAGLAATNSVPEPGTLVLVALGGVAAVVSRRRRPRS